MVDNRHDKMGSVERKKEDKESGRRYSIEEIRKKKVIEEKLVEE